MDGRGGLIGLPILCRGTLGRGDCPLHDTCDKSWPKQCAGLGALSFRSGRYPLARPEYPMVWELVRSVVHRYRLRRAAWTPTTFPFSPWTSGFRTRGRPEAGIWRWDWNRRPNGVACASQIGIARALREKPMTRGSCQWTCDGRRPCPSSSVPSPCWAEHYGRQLRWRAEDRRFGGGSDSSLLFRLVLGAVVPTALLSLPLPSSDPLSAVAAAAGAVDPLPIRRR